MLESYIQSWADVLLPGMLMLAVIGFVSGLVIGVERWLRSAMDESDLTEMVKRTMDESDLTEMVKRTMDESDLTEMVNAEVDDWTYQLQELGLDDALPQWVIDNLRERMFYVASAAANGRKSKSEAGS